jgi:hypothetical protein
MHVVGKNGQVQICSEYKKKYVKKCLGYRLMKMQRSKPACVIKAVMNECKSVSMPNAGRRKCG